MASTFSYEPAQPLHKFTLRSGSIRLPNYVLLAPAWPLSDLASKTPADLLASLLALNPAAAWQAFTPLCLAAIYGRLLGDHGTPKERLLLKLMFKHSVDIRAHHASLTARYPPGLVPDLANYCHAIRVPLEFALDDPPVKPLPRALFEGLLDTVAPAPAEPPAEVDPSATVRAVGECDVNEPGGSTPQGNGSQSLERSIIIKSEIPKFLEGETERSGSSSSSSSSSTSDGPASKPSSEVSSRQSAEMERRVLGAGPLHRSGSSSSAAAPAASSTPAATPPAAPPQQQQQIIEVHSSGSGASTTPEPERMTRKRSWARAIKEEGKPAEEEEGWVRIKREEEEEEGEGEVQVVAKRSRRGKVIKGF